MILCRLNEWLGPKYTGPFVAALHNHSRSCEICQRSERASASLASLLKVDSKRATAEPSPFLSARIVKGLHVVPSERGTRLGIDRSIYRLALPIAAGVVIAYALLSPSPTKERSPIQSVGIPQPEPQVKPSLPAFPEINIKVADPLTIEMESLLADSRIAARSLAANFLPDPSKP
ncbi:MAG: hypothetical protein JWM99_4675 [Verrucomicrobiales bacterium]|jgi:hypothetical protein|nr:hypothetical protein [Verrucomicrobiales bacterium]